ncbi:MAG: winged helix-turn-helix domain-containing protein [Actinomycetota bacterium]|nr:winged helix-turn-helix domain-containing protein [Actinomycetota bacterium]
MSPPEPLAVNASPPIEAGPLAVDEDAYLAVLDGRRLQLTHKEFQLLALLVRYRGRVLRRDQIALRVWGGAAPGRTIDIHVSRLRRQLPPGAIRTVIRVGYRLELS